MFNLVLAIACSSMVQIIMRLSTDKVKGNMSMLAMNYVVCSFIAACYTGFDKLLPIGAAGLGASLGIGMGQGLLYLLAFVFLQLNVKRNGMVLSASFMKLGLLVPMAVSVFCFGEQPGITHILGFVVALGAIILINYEPKGASQANFKAGLILLLLIGGLGDTMAKLYQELGTTELSAQFLFYTFASALVMCAGLILWKKEKPGKTDLLYGFLISIPNYFSSRFLLKSLEELNAVIVYPSYNVATIFIATLAGIWLFRERLHKRQWIAICAIIVALVLLNI